MFDGPEYQGYVALCIERRSPRVFRRADCLVQVREGRPSPAWVIAGNVFYGVAAGDDLVWLPRLDQLLSMLEEAGHETVAIIRSGGTWIVKSHQGEADGPTREEACLRLFCEVTGRVVPA